tara:strand:- start:1147 stop:1428 length:282 start_codon:yes stop_codon:yes gene_type:complete
MKINQTPLESKKFIAAMIWNILWLGILILAIKTGQSEKTLLGIIYTTGFVQSLYLGGQSFVDAFVRSAIAKKGSNPIITVPSAAPEQTEDELR